MDKIPRMLDRMDMTPGVKVIISMDDLDCSKPTISTQPFSLETVAELRRQAESLGIVLLDMANVIELGRQKPTDANLPKPTDVCLICYTSGTLAAQKGAIRTHYANVFASRSAHLSVRPSNSTYMSFVPLTHCADRFVIYALMFEHVRIGSFAGDLTEVIDDFQHLCPTVFLAVPIFLNRVYEKAAASTIHAPGVAGTIARYAYKSKLRAFKSGGGTKHAFWDKILFGKVAQVFGGRVQTIFSGAALLSAEVQDFFRVALSCNLIQGYGQTETFGSGALQVTTDTTAGHVGVPMPGIDMRLRSIPKMNISATSPTCPKGELMIRGKCIFSGYLKTPENAKDL
ncbi:medium-chain fatty acid-CoA ligase faa2, partial [Coemansia sp. IMI 209127]